MQFLKRKLPVGITVLLVVLAAVGTASALTITMLAIQHVSVASGQVQNSRFSITSENLKFQGPNKMTVDLTLTNTDSLSHSANVTVTILDSNGNGVAATTLQTGTVAGSGAWSGAFVFSQSGITASFSSYFVQITDLS